MTPGQCRAARSWLDWSILATAQRAGISKTTLTKFERGGNITYRSLDKIRRVFEAAGVEFRGRIHVTYRRADDEED